MIYSGVNVKCNENLRFVIFYKDVFLLDYEGILEVYKEFYYNIF